MAQSERFICNRFIGTYYQAGRIYTVTYSATDASGNKATASATVTVPHDQGK